jgi:hypothetical protein
MQRIASILILLVCLTFLPVTPAAAGFFDALFGDDTLVSIDGTKYKADEFKRWWKFWQEPDQPLPETPDPYINWLLLSREAERMDLSETPGFERQTRIFLTSRGLMLLKYEEVDTQADVSEAEIKARYEEMFLPRFQVLRITFESEEAALAAWKEIKEEGLAVDALLARSSEEGGPVTTSESRVRLPRVEPGWKAIFEKTPVGAVVDPSEHKQGPDLYYIKEQKEGDAEDMELFRAGLENQLKKERQGELTRALILRLRDKYEVKIDGERLAALDLNAPDDTFTDEAVITTNQRNVSEKDFIAIVRRLVISRPGAAHALADEEKALQLKKDTAENIIAQSVTDWEALDRRYEEREPFKWEYEFNVRHRLGVLLDQRLFMPQCEVTDDEIREGYERNIRRYTQPALAKFYILDETQGPLDRIWADVAGGRNFVKAMKEQDLNIGPQEAPVNHIDPEVGAVVEKLAAGETSRIFTAQGIRVMVHLLERTPEAPLPLERVKKSVEGQLREEKLTQARNEFLESLKARSEIVVRDREWKEIQKELGGL